MRKHPQRFTHNKQVVRDLQCETIAKYFGDQLGSLSYFGLPSSSLGDVKQWATLLKSITAVERGEIGKEWELQHDLELEAFRCGLFDKLTLLRGDVDQIILTGRDINGKQPLFPFDIVSLDYSGGLFYLDSKGVSVRIAAIEAVVQRQSVRKGNFVLLISCNLDGIDQGEVRGTLANMCTSLNRTGSNGDAVIAAYLKHQSEQARLKLYVPYLLNQFASKYRYHCETQPAIIYSGNLRTEMIAFRVYFKYDGKTIAPREPRERLSQIINAPLIEIVGGVQRQTTLDLPKLRSDSQ